MLLIDLSFGKISLPLETSIRGGAEKLARGVWNRAFVGYETGFGCSPLAGTLMRVESHLICSMDLTQSAEMLRQVTAPEYDPGPVPKALLVFAHPDDETVALGARIGRLRDALLVHVTDGAPANGLDQQAHGFETLAAYREARRQELDSMLLVAGVGELRRECWDVPDQEASLGLTEITRRVLRTVQDFKPQVVFTHPYEGGHPDHDACAFAVHTAVGTIRRRGEGPLIIEAPFYHGGLSGIEAGTFLPAEGDLPEVVYKLSCAEAERKEARLSCFKSQRETLSPFRLDEERFRIAPAYDFSRAPHAGSILYDDRPWGMNSQGFVQLASEAQTALAEEMKSSCN